MSTIRRLIGIGCGMLLSAGFWLPQTTLAQSVTYCGCHQPGSNDTFCFYIEDSKLTNPNDCSTLPSSVDLGDNWTCDSSPLSTAQSRTIPNGVCKTSPTKAGVRTGTTTVTKPTSKVNADDKDIIMTFNTPIPGFEEPQEVTGLLGAYIAAVYRYGLSILAIVTTIMFVWGAFMYLLGSTTQNIGTGKSIMMDAVIGMLLVIGATLILRTLNPRLIILPTITPETIEGTLAYDDFPPIFAGSVDPPPYGIPLECPSRSTYGGRSLSEETIQKYIEYQNGTGAPAAALIGQMFVESQGRAPCAMINMFDNLKSCGLSNFAGIGCTWDMTGDQCPHVAFGPAKIGHSRGTELPPEESQKYVDTWNNKIMGHGGACTKAKFGFSKQSYIASDKCGDQCEAIASHTNLTDDQGRQLWIESSYCLRKLDTADAFIDVHTSYVRHCLPFNKSVYKFVYCVGLTTSYASGWDYAKAIADAIERNCLCDPENDADGCQRDRELENDMANGTIKKFNFTTLASGGVWDEAAFQRVVEKVWELTDGRLAPPE